MTVHQWLGVIGLVALFGVIAIAFRQGLRVKPSGRDPHSSSIAGEQSTADDSGGPLV
jgi:hypothetical protein